VGVRVVFARSKTASSPQSSAAPRVFDLNRAEDWGESESSALKKPYFMGSRKWLPQRTFVCSDFFSPSRIKFVVWLIFAAFDH
jgi:hypothetical protein